MTEPVEVPRISGVKIDDKWKGEPPCVTAHVYVGTTDEELERCREQAEKLYRDTKASVGG